MTGSEHYREAEQHLAFGLGHGPSVTAEESMVSLAAAQVHATLAQAEYLREIGDQLDTFPRPPAVTYATREATS